MGGLVLAERAGHVLVATMSRPKVRNALSPALIDELSAVPTLTRRSGRSS